MSDTDKITTGPPPGDSADEDHEASPNGSADDIPLTFPQRVSWTFVLTTNHTRMVGARHLAPFFLLVCFFFAVCSSCAFFSLGVSCPCRTFLRSIAVELSWLLVNLLGVLRNVCEMSACSVRSRLTRRQWRRKRSLFSSRFGNGCSYGSSYGPLVWSTHVY